MADAMKAYRVTLEPIEDGWWMASIPSVQGCRTQGRTITQAKRRLREALALFVDDADKAVFKAHLKLPPDFESALQKYRSETKAAREVQARARALAQRLARRAIKELHLTMREAGELLGVSHQRIEQISR
jgi:predicted RNase H-like HicB family nuclease